MSPAARRMSDECLLRTTNGSARRAPVAVDVTARIPSCFPARRAHLARRIGDGGTSGVWEDLGGAAGMYTLGRHDTAAEGAAVRRASRGKRGCTLADGGRCEGTLHYKRAAAL